eukprot:Skav224022  [mRNA]  locus=scaffold3238:67124:106121:- [translate_table: standard]
MGQEVVDAEPHVDDVSESRPTVLGGLKHLERRSQGHSVLDVAAMPSAVPKEFLKTYEQAEGMSCTIKPGDVLSLIPYEPGEFSCELAARHWELLQCTSVLRLLGGLDESSLRAGLLLQAQVAYAECIIKLIREALVEEGLRTWALQGACTATARTKPLLMVSSNAQAGRVLLNLSNQVARCELHARRAENATDSGPFTEAQYHEFLRCAECCEEAASLSNGAVGRREGAFAHLRLAVHLSVRVPTQMTLGRRQLSELADRHLGILAADHGAELVAAGWKARLTSAQRHAKRSAEYWERNGALEYAKEPSSHSYDA